MNNDIFLGSVRERMTGLKCPACSGPADGATSIDDREMVTKAKPGDYTMCSQCGLINRFLEAPGTASGLALRAVTPEEWAELRRDKRLSKLLGLVAKGREVFIARKRKL